MTGARKTSLTWEEPARAELGKAPLFIRPLVRRKVEDMVRGAGRSLVTATDYAKARDRFKAMVVGTSPDELKEMLPAENKPGAKMITVSACRGQAMGCPNSLIDVDDLLDRVNRFSQAEDLPENLRGLVRDDKIMFHHKLKISLSGCPNGCSRPQIADFGLVGCVRPIFDLTACTGCGVCAEACPDQALTMADDSTPRFDPEQCQGCNKCAQACPTGAVSLSRPTVRLLVGGKLGRRPHLADSVGIYGDADQVLSRIDAELKDYLDRAEPNQSFAAYWQNRTETRRAS